MFDPRLGLEQAGFRAILRLLDSGRVWVKLSGRCVPRARRIIRIPRSRTMQQALAAHAPERMLWGSDWPHVQMNGPRHAQ